MAKSELEIKDLEGLEEWLKDKPIEWSQVIAARAALRVFPLVLDSSPFLTLRTFRAIFISWAACKYPAQDIKVAAVAADSAAASSFASSFASYAASYAAASYAVAAADSAAAAAASSASYAAAAAASSSSAASDTSAASVKGTLIWQSITADAVWLINSGKANELIHLPIWSVEIDQDESHEDVPSWIYEILGSFAISMRGKEKQWDFILKWYQALLPIGQGKAPYSFFGELADLAIALQPDEFWIRGKSKEDVEAVLADIAKIVDGKFDGNYHRKDDEKKPVEITERSDVKPNHDEPTAKDELGRRPFAESLVQKINEVRDAGCKDGFAVHLHAPWGAGKTSILLMMQDHMKLSASTEDKDKNWVVVNFNAWEHERRNPPWWPLIEAVKRDCSAYLAEEAGIRPDGSILQKKCDFIKSLFQSDLRAPLARWKRQQDRWCWWKLRSSLLPLVVFLIFGGVTVLLLSYSGLLTEGNKQADSFILLKSLFPLTTMAAGIYFTFLTAARTMVFGSKDNANYYFQLSNNPLGRIEKLFNKLINGVDRPVCIFIDDLDRCHADFVVDLLEGIQSSFRHEKVTYVVAADKGWIRSSFETRYDTFKDHVGDAAQPLGYLFLEKIFQLSTPIPVMAAYVKEEYFNHLLNAKETLDAEPELADNFNELVNVELKSYEDALPHDVTPDKIRERVNNNPTPVTIAAAVKCLDNASDAETNSKHLLSHFPSILSGNPREMKRLLNAFAMRRSLSIIQVSSVSMEELFRWTILEQSYPALADVLIDQPELIENFHGEVKKKDDVPSKLAPFIGIDAVYEIVSEYGATQLMAEHIREITKGLGN